MMMRLKSVVLFLAVAGVWIFCGHLHVSAAVQSYEDFDSNWTGAPWAAATNTATNAVSQWVVNSAQVGTNSVAFAPYSAPYYLMFSAGISTGSVESPLLSNGVGSLIYSAANYGASNTVAIAIRYEGSTNWTPLVTNGLGAPNTTWQSFTNFINIRSNLSIRLSKTLTGTASYKVFLDSISVTYPPASIAVTNLTVSPPVPVDNSSEIVFAAFSLQGYPPTLSATSYWQEWPWTNWTSLAMSSNQPNVFASDTGIPARPIGSTINYYASIAQLSDTGSVYSLSGTNSYVVRPRSSYTNMILTGQINTNLLPCANYQWQGVVNVTNANATFRFQGTSNGIPTIWGDANQTVSNLPLYGTADINATNITLFTTNSGYYVFSFTETNASYIVLPCTYENFETWTGTTYNAFGTYTNNGGWILSAGSVSNDAGRAFIGRSATLNGSQGTATNTFLQSPLLSNGIGQVSFWYRNWATNAVPAASLKIQSATSASGPWTDVPFSQWSPPPPTNCISTNYVFTVATLADASLRYLRIVNNPAGNNSRACIDEIVVTPPGASVLVSNLTNSPANPSSLDPVTISADLTPVSGAIITNVLAWYRAGSSLLYETTPMITTNGIQYYTTSPLPSVSGTNQYLIQYFFTGYQSVSPAFYPPTNTPYSYFATNNPQGYRYEPFDANWAGAPWTAATNTATNSISQWVVNSAQVGTNNLAFAPYSSPYYLVFSAGISTGSVESPLLTNGVGSLIFAAANNGNANAIAVAIRYEGATNWIPLATNSLGAPNSTWQSFTNYIGTRSNISIRLSKTQTGTVGYKVFLDSIYCAPAPTDVLVTNLTLNPGYPVANQSVTGSCDVISLHPDYPAVNVTPVLYWAPSGGVTNTVPMDRSSGNTFTTRTPLSLAGIPRDTPVAYWIRCDFAGYYAIPADNRSPRYSSTASFTTRAYSSQYSSIGAIVNGSNTTARMLTNGLWQSIVSFTTATGSTFNLSFLGSGYSAGAGYLTNGIQWGNSNNWKTALPLNDFAGTNQTNIALTGSFSGDYVVRFNEQTGEYIVQQCVFQDFETWIGAGGGTNFIRSENVNFPLIMNNFDNWTTNKNNDRFEDFKSYDWPNVTAYTNWVYGGKQRYGIYYSKISSDWAQTTNRAGVGFITQVARLPELVNSNALRGIGTISFDYKVLTNSPAVTLSVKGYTGEISEASYTADGTWFDLPSNSVVGVISNGSKTMILNTNIIFDLIFSHASGDQSVYFDNVKVTEWYADSQTNGGWSTSEGYIEQRSAGNNCCRLDTTRNDQAIDQQYVMSPVLSNGINAISFSYCGDNLTPVSFTVDLQYGTGAWTPLASLTNSTTNYTSYSYTVGTSTNNGRLRVRNTTPAPGVLLVDDFKISAKIAGLTWSLNNASIDETDPSTPPTPRQYYGGACYLNSNRTANINFADTTNAPDTNATAYLLSPKLSFGVGEISFWYRNWATASPKAASLYIQTSAKDLPIATNSADWSTVYVLSNVVNTTDYQYLQLGLYDTTSKWVRIYNDINTNVGRACLDDILITAPLASSFAMSNLTVSPLIPLYTNTVDVYVDIYQLFLNPTNITLTALYGTSTNYAGLTNTTLSSLPMTCISSNLTTPGRRFRYKTTTPIPTNAIDTFVRYGAKASWGGYNAQAASPKTNSQFGTTPTWYAPMDTIYTNNIAYYVVYSCPTGTVWFNEVNYIDGYDPNYDFSRQFVELCGPAGVNIHNWRIDIYDGYNTFVASYNITTNFVIADESGGHGFWVLGKSSVTNVDMVFTNSYTEGTNTTLSLPAINSGRLILRRSWGPYEQKIAYESPASGYIFVGTDDWDYPGYGSLGLRGSGTNYSDFLWAEKYGQTAGQTNGNQTLYSGSGVITYPPSVLIVSFRINSNVWIECTKTSGWFNAPWYSTNLLNTNLWATVATFTNTPNASNDVISFPKPTNNTVYFYKVISTNGL